jgi:hypothetical protein
MQGYRSSFGNTKRGIVIAIISIRNKIRGSMMKKVGALFILLFIPFFNTGYNGGIVVLCIVILYSLSLHLGSIQQFYLDEIQVKHGWS